MASENVTGPREQIDSDALGGAFQFTALAAETGIRVPSEWLGLHCRILWSPATAGDKLFFLFVAEDSPLPSIDETTDSSGTEPDYSVVNRAADWIESGATDEIAPKFPAANTVLLVKPEGTGHLVFRAKEG